MINSAKFPIKIGLILSILFLSLLINTQISKAFAIEPIENQENLWNIDEETRTVISWDNVVEGQNYVLPFNSNVSIQFTELPEDAGKLIMKQIQLSNEEIRKTGSLYTVAYEFILKDANLLDDLENSTFKYNLTLPKPEGINKIDIKYADTIGEIDSNRSITENIEFKDKIYIKDLDHFTVFVISNDPVNCPSGIYSAGVCYDTIQQAIEDSVDGDEIHVLDGTYSECLTIDTKTNLLIVGQSIDGTILDASACTVSGIHISNSDQISLGNFSIDSANSPENNVLVEDSTSVSLTNIDSDDSLGENILLKNTFGITLSDLVLSNGSIGISLDDSYNAEVGNITSANGTSGINVTTAGAINYAADQKITFNGDFILSEPKGIFFNETNVTTDNIPFVEFTAGSSFDQSTSSTLVDNHSKRDIVATGIAWGEISVSAIEARMNHDCNSTTFANGFCNGTDYGTEFGIVNYGAGIIISSPQIYGWNVEGSVEDSQTSTSANNLPIDLACGDDKYTNSDSISLVWKAINNPNAKYQRTITKPDSTTIQSPTIYSNNYFDFEDIFDIDGLYKISIRAFIDNDNDGVIDSNEYFSDFGTGCSIYYDSSSPVVTINTLSTGDPTPSLTGTIDDINAQVVVNVDGFDYSAINNVDGTWTVPDNIINSISGNGLAVGVYEVVATATDSAGNIGTDSTTNELEILENNAPSVSITDPADTSKVHGTIDVQFTATDDFGMNYYSIDFVDISDSSITTECSDTTVYGGLGLNLNITCSVNTIAYSQGTFRIDVIVGDDQDNTTTESIVISIDNVAPVLSINSLSTTNSSPALTGGVDDPTVEVVVTVNSVDYTAVNNTDGTWSIAAGTINTLPDGTYNVVVKATDEFGNEGTDSTTDELTIDSTAPVVEFKNQIVKESLSALPAYSIKTKSEDIQNVNCSYEGELPTWAEDDNNPLNIHCEFEDSVGNSGAANYALQVANNVPSVSISSKPGDTVTNNLIELSAKVIGGNSGFTYLWSGSCSGISSKANTPSTPGTYSCSVRVTDADGDVATANKTVVVKPETVVNQVPTLILFGNSPANNLSGVVNVSANTDFTITSSVNTPGDLNYSFSFTDVCSGGLQNTPSTTFASDILNLDPGNYICRATVTDSNGDVAGASVAINVLGTTNDSTQFIEPEVLSDESDPQVQGDNDSRVLQEITENAQDIENNSCDIQNKVSGFVYVKNDNNGTKNSAEEGIGSAEIIVTSNSNENDVFTIKSNSNGYWEKSVCPGEYNVEINSKSVDSRFMLDSLQLRTVRIPENADLDDINFEFKKSGGFNWLYVSIPLVLFVIFCMIYLETSRRKNMEKDGMYLKKESTSSSDNFLPTNQQVTSQATVNENVAKQIFKS